MGKTLSLFAALAVLVAGCSFSSVDPDADVTITGRALDASGKPLVNADVLLFKQADIGEVIFGAVLAVGTLATICLLPDPPAICDDAQRTSTDSDGRYEFELKGSDTQGTAGTESTMNVVFASKSGKASTSVTFTAEDTEITLPDARLWRAGPQVTQSAGSIRLSWQSLPAAAGGDPSYSAQLYEPDGSLQWAQAASGSSADLDVRILEDRDGSVAVNGYAELSGAVGADEVRGSYLSARLPAQATAGAPPSRGRVCAPVTGTAQVRDGRFSACGVTDGDLDQAAQLKGRRGAVVSGVVVDLGSPRPVSLVVARGFGGQVLVETSTDGGGYQSGRHRLRPRHRDGATAHGDGTLRAPSLSGRPLPEPGRRGLGLVRDGSRRGLSPRRLRSSLPVNTRSGV